MDKDIADILEGWDYNPYEINVRVIRGKDGKDKIQLRLDLGLLQMEMDGRPDGKKPHGMDSLLDYYKKLAAEHSGGDGNGEEFGLDADDLIKLHHEAIQFYHRYLCFFQLEDFVRAERDTARNLEVIEFAEKYCDNEDEVWSFKQYWPYIIMMNTRAKAAQLLQYKKFDRALGLIHAVIDAIKEFYEEYGVDYSNDDSNELKFLENWADSIMNTRPMTSRQKLEKDLEKAISRQEFEKAAKIRDKLRSMKK